MTKKELSEAYKIAMSEEDLFKESLVPFDGFGLSDFLPVYVTLRQIARLIRWQAVQMNGEIDQPAFQEIATYGKRRFMVI